MVVRGVYTKAEKKMLEEWREKYENLVGWLGEKETPEIPYPVSHRVASKDLLLHMAYAADYWNPLWRDESYARNTRWGGIIATPFFPHCISHGGAILNLEVPPEVGVAKLGFPGQRMREDWEFLKPIYVNDSFRVWFGPLKIEDITLQGSPEERRFSMIADVTYINQKNEIVSVLHRILVMTIFPPGTKMKKENELKFAKEFVYTKEDIEAIDRVFDAEEIRGAKLRFWEDINSGDELKPVVMGPITVWDAVVELQGFGIANLPMMEIRRKTPDRILIDPNTNIPHKSMEMHLGAEVAKMFTYSTNTIANTLQHLLGRLITNWMGDDGFLRRIDYLKVSNPPIGDTLFGRGKVVKKYIDKNGDYLVDLNTWVESIRGYIPSVATATVCLVSKENPLGSMGFH